jgi:hypothetical protein
MSRRNWGVRLNRLSIGSSIKMVTPDHVLRVVTIFSVRMFGKLLKLLKFNGDGWGTRIRT